MEPGKFQRVRTYGMFAKHRSWAAMLQFFDEILR